MTKFIALAVAALALPGCATTANRSPDAQLATLLKGRTAEPAVRCITMTNVNTTQIVEERAIVYGIGRRLYVNVPRGRADTLRADDILITQPFGSQLCRNDQVRLLDRTSRIPRNILLLGDFVPYALPPRK